MADVGKKTGKQTQAGRDVYETSEGEMVSEKSTTFKYKGKWVNIPTIHNGKEYSDAELIEMLDEGLIEPTSTHDKLEEALEAAESRSDSLEFDKGDTPMLEEQMKLFNKGGLKDEGGEVDPESGNDVPIGSTKKEVRDDIPAMLSEGEFVFPADVVRYIGLENLMRLRQDAKMGLKKMEAMGQMGNSEEATIPDDMPFDMADLIIVTSEPEEDKPKEMAQGGVIQAQTGTFVPSTNTFVPSTGIGGYQQSVFQNQPQVSAPFIPPSSIAPPTPAPSPAGGYMPKFITNQTTPFDDGSLAPKTNTGTTDNTGTTGTTDDFVPTVDDVYTQKEYFNPETGETRIINFYNNNPINEIPEGFVLKETYKEDETTTTDLESTSVETTQVRDDKSGTKKRLEDMVRQQSGNKLSELKEKVAKGDTQSVIDAYLQNEKAKALMKSVGFVIPIAGLAGVGAANLYGKQLENLMKENGIEIPKIETGFIENLKGAFSNIFTTTSEESGTYNPMYDPSNSPLTTVSNATNMLSMDQARAYDNAVTSGNANVAEHYEIINNRFNKMSDFMAAGGDPALGTAMGLSTYDIAQAQVMFNSDGEKIADSVNEANESSGSGSGSGSNNNDDDDNSEIEKIAQANAAKIAKANLDQAKIKLEEAAAANPNENIYTGGGPMGGFKEGGLVNKKKKKK